jgi:hypothetical protein
MKIPPLNPRITTLPAMRSVFAFRSYTPVPIAKSQIEKLTNPIQFIKYRMKLIDDARITYESCSGRFEKETELLENIGLETSFETVLWVDVVVLVSAAAHLDR